MLSSSSADSSGCSQDSFEHDSFRTYGIMHYDSADVTKTISLSTWERISQKVRHHALDESPTLTYTSFRAGEFVSHSSLTDSLWHVGDMMNKWRSGQTTSSRMSPENIHPRGEKIHGRCLCKLSRIQPSRGPTRTYSHLFSSLKYSKTTIIHTDQEQLSQRIARRSSAYGYSVLLIFLKALSARDHEGLGRRRASSASHHPKGST